MAAAAILGGITTVVGQTINVVGINDPAAKPYRPSYWSSGKVTSITVPGITSSVGTSQTTADGSAVAGVAGSSTQTDPPTVYVFDGIARREHHHRATPTRLPTQTGAAATDHIIIEPVQLVLEILMSDAMDSYTPGQWSGASSKSVSAFQVLESLRLRRAPLTVSTRLYTYTNLFVTDISVIDDHESMYGLRATVTLDQIIIGSVDTTASNPARPQLTGSTSQGQTGTSPVPAAITNNNLVPSGTAAVPGAGMYSSNPTGS